MFKIVRLTTIAFCLLLASCHTKSSEPVIANNDSQLSDAADSLAWFLAEAYADYALNLMDSVPYEYSANFNPELFAEGFVSILQPEISKSGKQFGIIQGALANQRIMQIRSCSISINTNALIKGFEKGLSNISPQDTTTAILDRLMAPVNRQIIREKHRMHNLTK